MALPPLLSGEDLLKFRTRGCERLLSTGGCHFGEKCQYSHGVWIRRPLWKLEYSSVMCQHIGLGNTEIDLQKCTAQRKCRFAHTLEEQLYHPHVYKTVLCQEYGSDRRCPRYYCPFAHGEIELISADVARLQRIVAVTSTPRSNRTNEFFSPTPLGEGQFGLRLPAFFNDSSPFVTPSPTGRPGGYTPAAPEWVSVCPNVIRRSVPKFSGAYPLPTRIYEGRSTAGDPLFIKEIVLPAEEALLETVRSTLQAFEKLEHQHLLVPTSYLLHPNATETELWLTEAAAIGPIADIIGIKTIRSTAFSHIPPRGILEVCGALLNVVTYLHENRLPHLRLHPSNLLSDAECRLRVANCAGALFLPVIRELLRSPEIEDLRTCHRIVSKYLEDDSRMIWMAPEIAARCVLFKDCAGLILSTGNWTADSLALDFSLAELYAADAWSAGACIFFIASGGLHPFGDPQVPAVVLQNIRQNTPLPVDGMPSLVADLVSSMTAATPGSRPLPAEAARHLLFWDAAELRGALRQAAALSRLADCGALAAPALGQRLSWGPRLQGDPQLKRLAQYGKERLLHEGSGIWQQTLGGLITFLDKFATTGELDGGVQLLETVARFPEAAKFFSKARESLGSGSEDGLGYSSSETADSESMELRGWSDGGTSLFPTSLSSRGKKVKEEADGELTNGLIRNTPLIPMSLSSRGKQVKEETNGELTDELILNVETLKLSPTMPHRILDFLNIN